MILYDFYKLNQKKKMSKKFSGLKSYKKDVNKFKPSVHKQQEVVDQVSRVNKNYLSSLGFTVKKKKI
jgi:hypothetical protein